MSVLVVVAIFWLELRFMSWWWCLFISLDFLRLQFVLNWLLFDLILSCIHFLRLLRCVLRTSLWWSLRLLLCRLFRCWICRSSSSSWYCNLGLNSAVKIRLRRWEDSSSISLLSFIWSICLKTQDFWRDSHWATTNLVIIILLWNRRLSNDTWASCLLLWFRLCLAATRIRVFRL